MARTTITYSGDTPRSTIIQGESLINPKIEQPKTRRSLSVIASGKHRSQRKGREVTETQGSRIIALLVFLNANAMFYGGIVCKILFEIRKRGK